MLLCQTTRPVKGLWTFVIVIQVFLLVFTYLLFFPGLDALARAGAGSVSNPLLIGSCIAGFGAYSAWIIREKSTPAQYAAMLLCLLGVIALCA